MDSKAGALTKEQLQELPKSYFRAIDSKDLDAIVAHFTDDAVLTVQTRHDQFVGTDAIRDMYAGLRNTTGVHEVKGVVADPETLKIATEHSYEGVLADGTPRSAYNCNMFQVNAEGKIVRATVWVADS